MKKIYTLVFLATLFCCAAQAQLPQITLTQWPSNSITFNLPLLVTDCGDSRKFVVQRDGHIYIVDSAGNKLSTPFLNIQNLTDYTNYDEEGLLGLAFDPDYKNNGFFYVNYTGANGNNPGPTNIVRYSVSSTDPNVADPNSAVVLLTIQQPYVNHNGGNLVFGPDGYLYDGQGDGGSGGDPGNRAQNKHQLLGKLLRIDPHGGVPYGIPVTNPWANDTTHAPELWSMGMRNPWRFNFDRITGDLWIGDVGQDTYEEVDYEPAGSPGGFNCGWRCYEGFHAYNTSGCQPQNTYQPPILEYKHVIPAGGTTAACSITGGYVYRGAQYHNLWGRYLFTDYCAGALFSILPDGAGGWKTDTLGNFNTNTFSSFGQDNEGELYLCAHNSNKIYKITSDDCKPVAYILQHDSVVLCSGASLQALYGTGLTYQWQLSQANIAGATNASYAPTASGHYRVIVTKGLCSDTSNEIYAAVCPLGVPALNAVSEATIVPNPNNGEFGLTIKSEKSELLSLQVYNIFGSLVLSQQILVNKGTNQFPLRLSNPAAGFYSFTLKGNDAVRNGSFIVK